MGENTTMYTDSSCNRTLPQFNTTGEFMQLLVPPSNGVIDNDYWSEKTPLWKAFFYIMLILFGILFLALAIFCLLMLAKRHLVQRFKKIRTFIAIDVALTILGFSRVFFLILDPWGQSGFCTHKVCEVLSRLSGALAFPSITASYSLVFITLWMSARIQLGRSSYQTFKILVPLCFVHYCVAILFETVGFIPWPSGPVVVMYLLISCEALFSLWGFLLCFGYLFAGHRLLHSIEKSARNSSMICKDSPNLTRQQLIEKSKFQNQKYRGRTASKKLKDMVRDQHKRAIRKVSIIMYLTVLLGMLYSILSLGNLVRVILTIFDGCPGFIVNMQKQNPAVWLVVSYLFFTLEFLLAVLLTYSITDYRPLLIALRGGLTKCCRMGSSTASRKQSPDIVSSSLNTLNLPMTPKQNGSPKHHVKFTFEESTEKDDLENIENNEDKNSHSLSVTPEPIISSGSSILKQSHEYLPSTPSPLATTHSSTIPLSNGVP